MTVDMKKGMVRAAKLRAAVLSHLHNNVGGFTVKDFMRELKPLVDELEYGEANVYSVLHGMDKNAMLDMRKDGIANKFYRKNTAPQKARQEVRQAPVKEAPVSVPAAKLKATHATPDVKVDFVTSTGRLRFSIAGVSFEFGVVRE